MSTPTTPIDSPEQAEEAAQQGSPTVKLHRFSDWVHIGPGAEECEHRLDGKCEDEEHFHGWCALPNKFQVADIREKAQAARARVIRQAKDPSTDRYEILENQLAEARDQGAAIMVEELLSRNMYRLQHQAMRELAEEEDSEFANIEEDQRRWRELEGMEEVERDADEYNELTSHLQKWNEAVDNRYEELVQPERDSLEGRTDEELVEMMRDIAVREQADGVFMRTFAKYQWLLCTLKPRGDQKRPVERIFADVAQLQAAPPEVVAALEVTFNDLEAQLSSRDAVRAEGN
jgi:hypothetical protein